jgi:hypothetical protein
LKLGTMRRLEVVGTTLAFLVVGGALAFLTGGSALALGVVVAVLAAGAASFRVMDRRSRSWGYLERDEDLLVRRGVMFLRISVVPYGRMQSIEVTAGPVERSFGLATVRLHTASAASDARIPGLSGPDAAGLRDRLASLGESRAEGL